jgi:hypothetical protein
MLLDFMAMAPQTSMLIGENYATDSVTEGSVREMEDG